MKLLFKMLTLATALSLSRCSLNAQVGFSSGTMYKVGFAPESIAAGDLNGDGKIDFVTANYGGGSLSVFTNRGKGDFVLSSTTPVNSPSAVAIADVNGDGSMDLICANVGGNSLTVLTNKGSGVFIFSSSYGMDAHAEALVVADVNDDGKSDLIGASYNNGPSGDTLSVFTNSGGGQFLLATNPGIQGAGYSVAAGDVNEDGYTDLISCGAGYINVLTNNHSAGFKTSANPYTPGAPQKVAVADVNGDSHLDLITANVVGDTVSIFTNDGNGNFSISSSPSVLGGPDSLAVGDVNGDGKVDLVVGTIYGSVYTNTGVTILTNDGSGGFAIATKILVGGPSCEFVADLNDDGEGDLLVASEAFSQSILFAQTPQLVANNQADALILSWRASWTNWTLQKASGLLATNWAAALGVSGDGTNNNLTIEKTNSAEFFRLIRN